MKKLGIISLVVFALAAVAAASPSNSVSSKSTVKIAGDDHKDHGKGDHHQCVPEPLTMLALIPGVGMLIRRRKKA